MSKNLPYLFILLVLFLFLFATIKSSITGYSILEYSSMGINMGYFAILFIILAIFVIVSYETKYEKGYESRLHFLAKPKSEQAIESIVKKKAEEGGLEMGSSSYNTIFGDESKSLNLKMPKRKGLAGFLDNLSGRDQDPILHLESTYLSYPEIDKTTVCDIYIASPQYMELAKDLAQRIKEETDQKIVVIKYKDESDNYHRLYIESEKEHKERIAKLRVIDKKKAEIRKKEDREEGKRRRRLGGDSSDDDSYSHSIDDTVYSGVQGLGSSSGFSFGGGGGGGGGAGGEF